MVEVSCSFFIQPLICSENASRKKTLHTKASRDNFKSQRILSSDIGNGDIEGSKLINP